MAMVAMVLALAPMLPGGKYGHIGDISLMALQAYAYGFLCS